MSKISKSVWRMMWFIITGMMVAGTVLMASCTSLGISTKGAAYFEGKKEADLVKYFGYDGEPVESGEGFDKAAHFTNRLVTLYMDKTTTKTFKNKRYALVYTFNFQKLPDGCLLYPGTIHKENIFETRHNPDGTVEKINRETHRNNNSEITAKLKKFDDDMERLKPAKRYDDEAMFNQTDIGGEYYVYNIEINTLPYSDNGGSGTAENYTYTLSKASVYEDSKSTTDTQVAYTYNDREKQYYDADKNAVTEGQAFENESSYAADGYESRRKESGIALTAFIKDGVVVKVVADGE